MGIFKTNAMVISNDKSCLFPLVCRANHACVPNCTYIWDDETGLQNLYACDNILPGEELTVSYLPDNMVEGRTSRRGMLRALYRFDCICELCSNDCGIMFEQDERDRVKAKMLIEVVNKTAETMDCSLGGDVHKLMYSKTCKQLYKHLSSMRIHPTLEYLVLNCLFSISILLLDQEQAIQYAERASCLSKKLTGGTSSNTKDWELTCTTIKDQFEDLEILQSAVNSWCFII
ncbi:SET and MYND domain-containing protein 5 [Eurytemora carolleeae]|uniref:SET and MYND domain-containing protein 5 n=1 Tax=Eurytemora carolleeae TaxID=1294199 RepID=UPI000C765329|nr:SET and MYND domain-containing protein 5 [Eurytemora carolleeae]|eukprot:XP_023329759.1 SET and MYND domain-containing protein 5-like [Eurytemora affinis]